ncbi:uncharacterized LOC106092484 [Stomoxys calcitrans]|uniref:uncharacterized LOC106092484 n=1 Tax=Stomoxys calcitrans TaxID=35570 RepID=UPI0027E37070|nr:uncharacterized LOC106092484 [Stomoxys calcitrans]
MLSQKLRDQSIFVIIYVYFVLKISLTICGPQGETVIQRNTFLENGCYENPIKEPLHSDPNRYLLREQWICPPNAIITHITKSSFNGTANSVFLKQLSSNSTIIERTAPLENGCFQETIKQVDPLNASHLIVNNSLICPAGNESYDQRNITENILNPLLTIIERTAPLDNGCFEEIVKESSSTSLQHLITVSKNFICPPGLNVTSVHGNVNNQLLPPHAPNNTSTQLVNNCNTTNHCKIARSSSKVGISLSLKGLFFMVFMTLLSNIHI